MACLSIWLERFRGTQKEDALQMKGWWESNINVRFPFMYSQKWNCASSLFPKQNYNVLSPNSYTHIPVRDLYISRISLSILLQQKYVDWSWEYINRSHTHECRKWNWGRALPFPGIYKLDFWYCASVGLLLYIILYACGGRMNMVKGGQILLFLNFNLTLTSDDIYAGTRSKRNKKLLGSLNTSRLKHSYRESTNCSSSHCQLVWARYLQITF